ncbi:lytic transglycosylase domain-containing protein [Paracoccus sp. (in: a-proteobacteria)]|uniref:lytic transglycosylase domain-containing protein n=1 Tax=Paracoccus sp. TaxID=267 RepID=UPI0026E07674|nr:lytic transglycosylase domain-containing protein [Paracoccus sp. (in: a-proteobacteria)]MDO5647374.1 lytic transglycosylase domain-containing protein [Paracoccus sp. (in: a-proteobacteria)]
MPFKSVADRYANQYGVDPTLFRSLVNQESRWDPNAKSPVGALGLGQVMPDTARQPGFGVSPLTNPLDPEDNLRFSAQYMSALQNRYPGDINRALAAYNWGVGNADKWDGDLGSLPTETRDYVQKIAGGGNPAGANSFGPVQGTSFTPSTSYDSGAFSGMIDQQFPAPPQDEPSAMGRWLNDKAPWLTNDRAESLLALGTGILSGDDWASGLAAAGQNMAGVLSQRKQNERQDIKDRQAAHMEAARAERDHAFRMEQTQFTNGLSSAALGQRRTPAGPVQMPDGSIRGDLFYTADGRIVDSGGQELPPEIASQIVQVTRSNAGGDKAMPGPANMVKMREDLETGRNNIQSIHSILEYLDGDPTMGAGRLWQDLQSMQKTIRGVDLNDPEVQRKVAQGDIESLIGGFRLQVVGPGVMTEQDALRVLAAIGGDLNGYLQHPDVLRERLGILLERSVNSYRSLHGQYSGQRQAWPQLQWFDHEAPFDADGNIIPRGKRGPGHDAPATFTNQGSASSGTQASPVGSGLSNEEWKALPQATRDRVSRALSDQQPSAPALDSSNSVPHSTPLHVPPDGTAYTRQQWQSLSLDTRRQIWSDHLTANAPPPALSQPAGALSDPPEEAPKRKGWFSWGSN